MNKTDLEAKIIYRSKNFRCLCDYLTNPCHDCRELRYLLDQYAEIIKYEDLI